MLFWLVFLTTSVFANTPQDPYLWLEEVEGKKAIEWVKKQNEGTLSKLEADPRYNTFKTDAEKILNAPDKLAEGTIQGDYVYNFWQDEKNVRGLWRRAKLETYNSGKPQWETLIDVDELAKKENENWVYKRIVCFEPVNELCLVSLSRGGKDVTVTREFAVSKKQFVKGGFETPESRNTLDWIDENTLIAALPLNDKTKTDAGYAKQVQIWKRGEKAAKAQVVLEISKSDTGAFPSVLEHDGREVILMNRAIDMNNYEYSILESDLKTVTPLPLPKKAQVQGLFKNLLLVTSKEDWSLKSPKGKETKIRAGELVAFDLDKFKKDGVVEKLYVLYTPSKKTAFQSAAIAKNTVFITFLDNVNSKILRKEFKNGNWVEKKVNVDDQGTLTVISSNPLQDDTFLKNTNFLTPSQIIYLKDGKAKVVHSLPARFDAKNMMVEQKFTKSADGTSIPFFVVRRKDAKLDGNIPTLLYAYGGFGNSMTPWYSAIIGKLWLERGGTFVIANIRGGSEFGPNWHLSVIKENRNKCFEDFIAVGEELVEKRYTSKAKLAIMGGSNGGLLVSATAVMRPDLFGAVISQVPLTDMLRFHKLLVGNSWMGEYGNPEEEKVRDFWLKYSPFQNVKTGVKYPPILFETSTKDDRVHPGHARKMAARMMEFGQDVSYYENIEGGHSASANLLQVAKQNALSFVFLSERLGLK